MQPHANTPAAGNGPLPPSASSSSPAAIRQRLPHRRPQAVGTRPGSASAPKIWGRQGPAAPPLSRGCPSRPVGLGTHRGCPGQEERWIQQRHNPAWLYTHPGRGSCGAMIPPLPSTTPVPSRCFQAPRFPCRLFAGSKVWEWFGLARLLKPIWLHLALFSHTHTPPPAPPTPRGTSTPPRPPPKPSSLLGELQIWGPNQAKKPLPQPACPAFPAGRPAWVSPGCPRRGENSAMVGQGGGHTPDSPRMATQSAEAVSQRRTPIPATPARPDPALSPLSWSRWRRNPAEPMPKPGPSPGGGKEPASCGAWRGGRAPQGARRGERVPAGSPRGGRWSNGGCCRRTGGAG